MDKIKLEENERLRLFKKHLKHINDLSIRGNEQWEMDQLKTIVKHEIATPTGSNVCDYWGFTGSNTSLDGFLKKRGNKMEEENKIDFKVGDWVKSDGYYGPGFIESFLCDLNGNKIDVSNVVFVDKFNRVCPVKSEIDNSYLEKLYPKFDNFEDNFMTLKESMKTRLLTDSERLKIVEDKLRIANKTLELLHKRVAEIEKNEITHFVHGPINCNFSDAQFTVEPYHKKEEIKKPKFEVGESCCIIFHNLNNLWTDVVCRSIKKVEKVKVDAATNKIKYKISDCDWHYQEHEMYKTNDPKILKVGDKVRVIESHTSGFEVVKKGTHGEIMQIHKVSDANYISINFLEDNISYVRCTPCSKIELVLD